MTHPAAKDKGKIFIISAPSGCGKTTLCKKLLNDKLNLTHSISATTRPARKSEKKGVDYFFVSPAEFVAMIDRKEFLEYEENFGHLYGTPKKKVDMLLGKGKNVLLSIDVKGAMNVLKLYPEESILIFIMPPTIDALKKRLETRSADTASSILKRLKLAKQEIACRNKYDYTIVNDRLDTAYKRLKEIINSEVKKTCRHPR